jgi:hypothetical protein
MLRHIVITAISAGALASLSGPTFSETRIPEAVTAPGESKVVEFHAEGAQIYECKADAAGKLAWQFREPIATLIAGGKTAGRHYAGPNWELADGSAVVGKVVSSTAGATAKDIAWLKLNVVSERGNGQLKGVTTVQRLNTKGGAAEGRCDHAGDFLSVPYSSDYVFLKKSQ